MDYKELDVWRQAIDFAVNVYKVTAAFPNERYGITAQMRRAVNSIASNIAEGEGRGSPRDHLRFLGQARGSLYEVETQSVIFTRLGYLQADALATEIERLGKLINGTIRSLKRLSEHASKRVTE